MSLVAGALVTFLVACLLAAAAIVAVPVCATVFAHLALTPIAVAVSEVHFLTCTNNKEVTRKIPTHRWSIAAAACTESRWMSSPRRSQSPSL